jgi:hypothetical protein
MDECDALHLHLFTLDTDLSASYRRALNSIHATHGDNLLACAALLNAEASSPFQLPKGNVLVLEPHTPVSADILNRRFPSVYALTRLRHLPEEKRNDEYFQAKLDRLQDYIPQYDKDACDLADIIPDLTPEASIACGAGRQHTEPRGPWWMPELGRNGIVGIFKVVANKRGKWRYYAFVACDLDKVAAQFYRLVKAGLAPFKTMKDLAMSATMRTYVQMARTNACKLLYRLGQAMDVEVPHRYESSGTVDFFSPMTAVPDFMQVNNTIEYDPVHDSIKSLHMATAPFLRDHGTGTTVENQVLVLLNPDEGFVTMPLLRADMPSKLCSGFPVTLGRVAESAYVTPDQVCNPPPDIIKTYCWEHPGQFADDGTASLATATTTTTNADTDTNARDAPPSNARLDDSIQYRRATRQFYAMCAHMGCAVDRKKEFIPVACKQSVPLNRTDFLQ